jgi:hypothetical protein
MSLHSGPVRILDTDGYLLTVGIAEIEPDEETGGWRGTLEVIGGTAVAGKALVVDLDMNGNMGRAQLIPIDDDGKTAHSKIAGLSPLPWSIVHSP